MTQSQAISQSIAFSSLSDQWERRKSFTFFIFRNPFLYKITVSFTMVIQRSPGGEHAGGGRSTWKSTSAVPAWSLTAFDLAIDQHPFCPNRARRELWPRKWFIFTNPRKWFIFARNPWRWACRSMELKMYTSLIVSTDLWPQRCFLYACNGRVWTQFRCLALYVCL